MGLSLRGLSHGGILGLLPPSEGLPAQPGFLQREEPLYRHKRHRRREALSVALRDDAPLFQVQFTDLAGLGERLSETPPLHGQLGLHGFIEQCTAHGAVILAAFAATMQCANLIAMLQVGLTGGIATRTNTVSRLFVECGAHLVDADVLAREVVGPGKPALQEIGKVFGMDMLRPNGTLNRASLGQAVLYKVQLLAWLKPFHTPH